MGLGDLVESEAIRVDQGLEHIQIDQAREIFQCTRMPDVGNVLQHRDKHKNEMQRNAFGVKCPSVDLGPALDTHDLAIRCDGFCDLKL